METIQATVNPRLLNKASRLFTGTLQGRVIEILQNARRAGATKVEITNEDGLVTVRDNGEGIEDFAKLLDLGGSGWEQAREASEDPAGVGLFCLAPREVVIRSNGKVATISGEMWTGEPVPVMDDPDPVQSTALRFRDEAWMHSDVDVNAVFCGMDVIVDGTLCPKVSFVSDRAVAHPELGCLIEVLESHDLDPWHHSSKRARYYGGNVLVNFHGQVVPLDYHDVGEAHLHFLVDLTGESTGIRLMLPARTCLVENEALDELKASLEIEAYRYIQKRGHHRLPYKQYMRARELGMSLPEAEPTFLVGLLSGDMPEPVDVVMPKDFPLTKCYRPDPDPDKIGETDEANIHLLAALGSFDEPFVPVSIKQCYNGYSWADLPVISKINVAVGKKLHESELWLGKLACVDSLEITVETNDDRSWTSPIRMAVQPLQGDKKHDWFEEEILVTPEAMRHLAPSDIWHHLGGWYDEGDTYDTQAVQFEEQLDRFWVQMIGSDEQLRASIQAVLVGIQPAWRTVTASANGTVTIRYRDGSKKAIQPPHKTTASQASR